MLEATLEIKALHHQDVNSKRIFVEYPFILCYYKNMNSKLVKKILSTISILVVTSSVTYFALIKIYRNNAYPSIKEATVKITNDGVLNIKFKLNENKLKHDKIYCAETNNIETTDKWILAENGECNINVDENKSIRETLKYLQKEAPDAESIYYLYVVDQKRLLRGVVSLRDIVCTDFDMKISEITNTNVIALRYDMDQEEVANAFEKYGFISMPVVDEKEKLLGIVTADDIMEVIKDESTEDIHRLGGIDEEEKVDGTLRESIKSRLPWLMVNLLTALLASAVVGIFEGTISQVVTLATFMPIVTGMGGNAGTQTLTIIVRGIALGELTSENAKRILKKEILVGFTTGIAIGAAIAVIGYLWERNFMFGIVIGTAMILNMVVATIAGFIVPVILKKVNVDPALASAVFVTTVTDVLGFFFFLGLATIFISYLN